MKKNKMMCTVMKEEEMSVSEIFNLINEPFRRIMTIDNRDVPYNRVEAKINNFKIGVTAWRAKNIVVENAEAWLKAESAGELINNAENYSGNVMELHGNGIWLNFKLDEDIFRKVIEKLFSMNCRPL
jgi:hypothetical protein